MYHNILRTNFKRNLIVIGEEILYFELRTERNFHDLILESLKLLSGLVIQFMASL